MPLIKTTYKTQLDTAIKTALIEIRNSMQEGDNPDSVVAKVADKLASAIADATDTYIKSATIIVPLGIPVSTAGSAAAQVGATTAPSSPATIS